MNIKTEAYHTLIFFFYLFGNTVSLHKSNRYKFLENKKQIKEEYVCKCYEKCKRKIM